MRWNIPENALANHYTFIDSYNWVTTLLILSLDGVTRINSVGESVQILYELIKVIMEHFLNICSLCYTNEKYIMDMAYLLGCKRS